MAGLSFKIDWSGMKDQFKEYANSQAKRLAIKAREEICKEYMITVGDFYAEFSPRVWQRQFQYFNSFTPFYENSHGAIYYGGIDINPGGMSDHYEEDSAAALSTMLIGIHGPKYGSGPTGLHVLEHMDNFVKFLAGSISL